METNLCLHLSKFCVLVTSVSCWQYFTKISDLKLSNTGPSPMVRHSEYIFGDCRRDDLKYYGSVSHNHIEILGKQIIRGWVEFPRIPLCIKLIAKSVEEHAFRSTSFPFQICVPRMTFMHTGRRWVFHYYEWFIPDNFEGGMDWDLHFFGPKRYQWW